MKIMILKIKNGARISLLRAIIYNSVLFLELMLWYIEEKKR